MTLYFLLFTCAILVRPSPLGERGRVLLPLGNATGLTVLGAFELRAVGGALSSLFTVVALAHLASALIAAWRDRTLRELADVYLAIAAAAATFACWSRPNGVPFAIVLALIAAATALAARLRASQWLAFIAIRIILSGLVRPPLLHPAPWSLLAFAVAALFGAEVVRSAPALARKGPLGGGYALVLALDLLRLASAVAPDGFETVAWTLAAVTLFLAGFLRAERQYRYAGFAALGLTAIRLLFVDLRTLGPNLRVVTFLSLGVLLLAVGYAYTRWRTRFQESSLGSRALPRPPAG